MDFAYLEDRYLLLVDVGEFARNCLESDLFDGHRLMGLCVCVCVWVCGWVGGWVGVVCVWGGKHVCERYDIGGGKFKERYVHVQSEEVNLLNIAISSFPRRCH